MMSKHPTVMGVHAPGAHLTPRARRWLIVALSVPLLAFAVLFDGAYYLLTRLR